MNHAPKILAYLGEGNRFSRVLLVAGAPPVEKVGAEFHIVVNAVLTPDDIRETLAFFASHSRRVGPTDLGNHGIFAFGLPKMGRFKVHYLTQRGSVFVSIQRMTYDIPALDTLLGNPGQIALVDAAMDQPEGGIVIFTGSLPDELSRLLYAILERLNQTKNLFMYILEQDLSYLLRHRNSVAVQVEVGTDITSLTEGIQNGLTLSPDLVYVREPKTLSDYSGLMCAAESGALVVVSIAALDEQHMMSEIAGRLQDTFPKLSRLVRNTIKVSVDQNGKLVLQEVPGPARAS